MIEKKIRCEICGQEHIIKLKDDYNEGDFMFICPETKQGVYVVVKK